MIPKKSGKYNVISFLLCIVIITLLTGCKQGSTDWAFYFVVWNEDIYEIDKTVIVDVADEIGTVKKHVVNEGNYSGVFSNLLPKGAKLYKIKEGNTDEAIAVELNGTFVEARNQGKYRK
ncbi:hypothetical protein [Sporosarcina sp. Te-1]|uniref:hypothetical protein n=1 Tax=Sporosarcina sp. Te-1 TaxID=2818390 RepID=UPI001A9E04B6|nr:hypothetical protein [Sporosarcina sp. Te-1]QTD40251.1 hypothetical protein J3U78_15775 [Sporosarcina sp. Te-1]